MDYDWLKIIDFDWINETKATVTIKTFDEGLEPLIMKGTLQVQKTSTHPQR